MNHELYPSHPTIINQSSHGSLLPDHFDSHHVMQPNDPAVIIKWLCSICYEPVAIEFDPVATTSDPVAIEYYLVVETINELLFIK